MYLLQKRHILLVVTQIIYYLKSFKVKYILSGSLHLYSLKTFTKIMNRGDKYSSGNLSQYNICYTVSCNRNNANLYSIF